MEFKMKYSIETMYLTPNTKRRPKVKMPYVGFVVCHDTGNPGSTALNNVNYYERTNNQESASAQTFIDDSRIIECIPATTADPEKAWHVRYDVTGDNEIYGDDANDIAIGVELCYGGKINNQEAYKRYVWYIAYLCYKFNLDPYKKLIGHNELDPARKLDPFKNALKLMGITKEQFIKDVAAELEDCTKQPVTEDDKPMKLAQWEKDLLIEGVKKFNKVKGADGNPVINSPDLWITKIENETITAGEIAILNFAILSRTVK